MLCLASEEAVEAEEVLAAGCGWELATISQHMGHNKSWSGECRSMFLSPLCHLHLFMV